MEKKRGVISYERSQSFNLVDVAAFLVAGPIGPESPRATILTASTKSRRPEMGPSENSFRYGR